jgi:hypothetical protein
MLWIEKWAAFHFATSARVRMLDWTRLRQLILTISCQECQEFYDILIIAAAWLIGGDKHQSPPIERLKGIASMSQAAHGETYLSPLVLSRSICIFRRTRSAVPEGSNDTFRSYRSESGKERPVMKSIGWFEFGVGSYVFSLNRA